MNSTTRGRSSKRLGAAAEAAVQACLDLMQRRESCFSIRGNPGVRGRPGAMEYREANAVDWVVVMDGHPYAVELKASSGRLSTSEALGRLRAVQRAALLACMRAGGTPVLLVCEWADRSPKWKVILTDGRKALAEQALSPEVAREWDWVGLGLRMIQQSQECMR